MQEDPGQNRYSRRSVAACVLGVRTIFRP
jgi:hypothetical protein